MSANPFITGHYFGNDVQTTDAADRLQAVKSFNRDQLLAALEVPGLQKTVRTAIERHLRKLQHLTPELLAALDRLAQRSAMTVLNTESNWRAYQQLTLYKLCHRQRFSLNGFCYVINDAGRARLQQETATSTNSELRTQNSEFAPQVR